MKKRQIREFSKRALLAMIALWFVGAAVMFGVVLVQLIRGDYMVNTGDLTMYVSAPMTGGILGYMLKSAAENKEKIKGGRPPWEDKSI